LSADSVSTPNTQADMLADSRRQPQVWHGLSADSVNTPNTQADMLADRQK